MIVITDAMLGESRDRADAIMANLKPTDNYTGVSEEDRFFHGLLGEFTSREWFMTHGIHGNHRLSLSGESQACEFIIKPPHSPSFRLDAKASTKQSYRYAMMPLSQKIDFDVLWAVRLDLHAGMAEMMGFAFRDEVERWPVRMFKTMTRHADYSTLRTPTEFIEFVHGGVDRENARCAI